VTLDWRQPWFAPLRGIAAALPAGRTAAEALNALGTGAPRFVASAELPAGEAYEAFIARSGTVPTRDNLHDLLNGLMWLHRPALKQRLNQLQAAQIAAHGVGPTRGALRDALTLFDEHGALWPDPPPALAQALAARDWRALFVTHRALWRDTRFEVFGHALLEQLASAPRKALTAFVALGDPLAWSADQWAAKPFLPLPVLGIPGWWPANEDPAFYVDSRVFRPPRLKAAGSP
jgi:Protein of unknown function (DUF3025)